MQVVHLFPVLLLWHCVGAVGFASGICNLAEITNIQDGGASFKMMLMFENNFTALTSYQPNTEYIFNIGAPFRFDDFIVYAETSAGERVGCFDASKIANVQTRACGQSSCGTLSRSDTSLQTGPACGFQWSIPCNHGPLVLHAAVLVGSTVYRIPSITVAGQGASCSQAVAPSPSVTPTPTPTPTPLPTAAPSPAANSSQVGSSPLKTSGNATTTIDASTSDSETKTNGSTVHNTAPVVNGGVVDSTSGAHSTLYDSSGVCLWYPILSSTFMLAATAAAVWHEHTN